MEVLLRARKTRAGTPSHSATPTVLVFQEALGFACVRDMVRFCGVYKAGICLKKKKQWKCLRKSLFGGIFFVVFLMVAMLVSALKRYPSCVYMSHVYRYMELCVFICV